MLNSEGLSFKRFIIAVNRTDMRLGVYASHERTLFRNCIFRYRSIYHPFFTAVGSH